MKKLNIYDLISRYIILLILGLGNLYLIYLIFKPLTIYPVYYFFKLFYNVSLSNTFLYFSTHTIEIIDACVAGSAYYLLLILNLATQMNLKTRVYSLLYSITILLILNITRIIVLSMLFINNIAIFNITHKIFWYLLSTVFVVGIWFSEVLIFKIKNIPVYSDISSLRRLVRIATSRVSSASKSSQLLTVTI